jgi:NO-binding membrane sensor protein with MHYT domain
MWALLVLAFVTSMLLAGRMARDRHRSTKAWVWIASFVGPLGPLALYVLGSRPNRTSHA